MAIDIEPKAPEDKLPELELILNYDSGVTVRYRYSPATDQDKENLIKRLAVNIPQRNAALLVTIFIEAALKKATRYNIVGTTEWHYTNDGKINPNYFYEIAEHVFGDFTPIMEAASRLAINKTFKNKFNNRNKNHVNRA